MRADYVDVLVWGDGEIDDFIWFLFAQQTSAAERIYWIDVIGGLVDEIVEHVAFGGKFWE